MIEVSLQGPWRIPQSERHGEWPVLWQDWESIMLTGANKCTWGKCSLHSRTIFFYLHIDGRRIVGTLICQWWGTMEIDFCVFRSLCKSLCSFFSLFVHIYIFYLFFCNLYKQFIFSPQHQYNLNLIQQEKIVPTNNHFRQLKMTQYWALNQASSSFSIVWSSIRALLRSVRDES